MTTHTLPTLVGNAQVLQQISGSRLGHAFIISGARGSGRHTLANLLAGRLLCSAPENGLGCGHCSNCKKVAAGIHPDLISVFGSDDKGKSLSVAEARQLHGDAYIAPNEGDRKVYLFHRAGDLSVAVQNVLLKLVEEGPPYAAFLFVTEHSGQLLQTVRSRCEELKLTPVSPEVALSYLQTRYPARDGEQLQQVVTRCEGLIGRAVAELEQGQESPEGMTMAQEFCMALARESELELVAFMGQREKAGREDVLSMCRINRQLLHNALRIKNGVRPLMPHAVCRELSELEADCLFALDAIQQQAIGRLEGNAAPGVLLGWLAASCGEAIKPKQ